MPNINKVIYGNQTLLDISDSTTTANNLLRGAIGYAGSGERVVGTLEPSGSGGGFQKVELYTASQDETIISLSQSMANFDLIELVAWYNDVSQVYTQNAIYNSQELIDSIGSSPEQRFGINNDTYYTWYRVNDVDELEYTTSNNSMKIKKVYGYKFSSGSGSGGITIDKLWEYSNSYDITLSHDFTDYDFLIFEGNNYSDSDHKGGSIVSSAELENIRGVSGKVYTFVGADSQFVNYSVVSKTSMTVVEGSSRVTTVWGIKNSGSTSWTDYTGTLTAGQTSITIPCELNNNSSVNVYTSIPDTDYNSLTVSGYSYLEFMDGKIVVRENQSDNTDIKLFICGLTKESSDITITDNDLLAYLSDITSGYLKACETFDTADSTTQTGILAISNDSGTMLLRTYVPGWLQYKAGTFYGVIDLNESPVVAQGAPAYQMNEYSDPYIGTSSIILTFDEQQTDLGVKVRVS